MLELIQNLKDAGCSDAETAILCKLLKNGQIADAVKRLRCHRCALMEALRRCQERVDCLDYLLRKLEKEANLRTTGGK